MGLRGPFHYFLGVLFAALLVWPPIAIADSQEASASHITAHYQIPLADGKTEEAIFSETSAGFDGKLDEKLIAQIQLIHSSVNPDPVLLFEIVDNESGRKPSSDDSDHTKLQTIRDMLESRGIKTSVVSISKSVYNKFAAAFDVISSFPGRIKETGKRNDITPTPTEFRLGVVSTIFRTAMTGYVWFSTPGVSPKAAVFLTVVSTIMSGFFDFRGRTMENLFRAKIAPNIGQISKGRAFWDRIGFNFIFAAIPSLVANGWGPASIVNHARTFANFLIGATGDGWLSQLRYNVFMGHGDNRTNQAGDSQSRYRFLTFLLLSPICIMDFAGTHGKVLADFHFFQVKTTTLEMIGAYAIAIGLLEAAKRFPRLMLIPIQLRKKPLDKTPTESGPDLECKDLLKPNGRKPAKANKCRVSYFKSRMRFQNA